MKIQEMHYEFKLGFDRVDSADRPDFLRNEIDHYLNRAIWYFLKERYDVDKTINRGFETDQSRIDELKTLHIKSDQLQPGVTPIDLGNGKYEVRLNSLGNNINGQYFRYMFYTDGYIMAEKDNCSKAIGLTIKQIDDDVTTYSDSSWLWRRVNANFGRSTYQHPHIDSNINNDSVDTTADLITNNQYHNDELGSLYLDTRNIYGEPQFDINQVYISYLKYPNRVFIGGYNHIDGLSDINSDPIHCDIDEGFHDEIIRIAISLAEKDIKDQLGIQVREQQVLKDKI
jgi:hypothetical protein